MPLVFGFSVNLPCETSLKSSSSSIVISFSSSSSSCCCCSSSSKQYNSNSRCHYSANNIRNNLTRCVRKTVASNMPATCARRPHPKKENVYVSRGSKEDDVICEGDRRSRLEVNNDEQEEDTFTYVYLSERMVSRHWRFVCKAHLQAALRHMYIDTIWRLSGMIYLT